MDAQTRRLGVISFAIALLIVGGLFLLMRVAVIAARHSPPRASERRAGPPAIEPGMSVDEVVRLTAPVDYDPAGAAWAAVWTYLAWAAGLLLLHVLLLVVFAGDVKARSPEQLALWVLAFLIGGILTVLAWVVARPERRPV